MTYKSARILKSIGLLVLLMPLSLATLQATTLSSSHPQSQHMLLQAQQPEFIPVVKGVILDETQLPLMGASVRIVGSKRGTSTNIKGEFTLKNVKTSAQLEIAFIGYKNQLVSPKTAIRVQLTPDKNQLKDVTIVSTGYQNIPRERAAGAFVTTKAKDLEPKLQTSILSRLEGMAAGATNYKGTLQVRGLTTLNASVSSPLLVVDGMPYEGDISDLNPNDVENITLLKDASAASIYGARSANGVIVINTKKGKQGPTRISYNGTALFTPLPDRKYQNLMSSAELVDFQKEMFGYNSSDYNSLDDRKYMNEVFAILHEQKAGNISNAEAEQQLDVYRNRNRYNQVKDEFIHSVALTQQHSLNLSGGSERYKYSYSGNYDRTNPYQKNQATSKVGFNLRNSLTLAPWIQADLGVLGSYYNADYDNGFNAMSALTGGRASYLMLRNDDGSPATWYNQGKSQFEIDRLNALGLQDETYKPIEQLSTQHNTNRRKYININLATTIQLMKGLNLNVLYQTERTEGYEKTYYNARNSGVRSQINNATIIDQATGLSTQYIPIGGQLSETRSDNNSYTFRSQLNYKNIFGGIHDLRLIAGAERRKVTTSGTGIYKYGYDDNSLNYKAFDELFLAQMLPNTQSIYNTFSYSRQEKGISSSDNRYVSFYGNGSYTYNNRLTASASIRMDQSNLFGSAPENQYRPLWSLGLMYVVSENKINWLDRLSVRATYGINGNIPKEGGPYMITKDNPSPNVYTNDYQSDISYPKNAGLRWEKTKVTNIGIDFAVLHRKLTGSIDFYNKATTDLLAQRPADPTTGWGSLLQNYGKMSNRGVDVSLTSHNINSKDFTWNSTLNFNYNRNRLTDLYNSATSVSSYLNGTQNRVGVAMKSLYSIRYAGLNAAGLPQAFKADGSKVTTTQALDLEDLVYSGTETPPYSASLLNNFRYKNIDLFLMFIYYGGAIQRDDYAPFLTSMPELNYTSNMDRNALSHWRQPGDERNIDMAPKYQQSTPSTITDLWNKSDRNVEKVDFIKLRDLSLGYNFDSELLRKIALQRLRISLQIQNLWRWQSNKNNLDSERWKDGDRGTLTPTTYALGLSATF